MNKRKRYILLLILISCIFFTKCGTGCNIVRNKSSANLYMIYTGKSNIQFINNQNSSNNGWNSLAVVQLIGLITLYGIIVKVDDLKIGFTICLKNIKAKKLIRSLQKENILYSKENMDYRIRKIIPEIYKGFFSMDIKPVEEYINKNTYERYKLTIEWMKIRKENFLYPNSKILICKIVGVKHYNDSSKDTVYFYLKVNLRNDMKKYREDHRRRMLELWKFTVQDGKWVLRRIMEINDLDELMKIKSFLEK